MSAMGGSRLLEIGAAGARGREPERRRRAVGRTYWDDPESVGGLADFLASKLNYKRTIEDDAIYNTAFSSGNQWRKFDRTTRRMVKDPDLEPWDAKLEFNLILPAHEGRISRLSRVGGGWGGAPETSDQEDVQVGRAIRQVLRHYWSPGGLDMDAKLDRLWRLTFNHKVAFLYGFWDPNKGEAIRVTPEDLLGAPQSPEGGPSDPAQAMMSAVAQFVALFGEEALERGFAVQRPGDLEVEVITLFEIAAWPFESPFWEDKTVWYRRRYKLTTELQGRYPTLDWEKIGGGGRRRGAEGAAGGVATSDDYERRLARAWGYVDAGAEGAAGEGLGDFTLVENLWLKAGVDPDYPDGAEAIRVGEEVVEESLGPLDNPAHVIPLFPVHEKPIAGLLYGTSTTDQMRGGQKDINLAASQMANYRNRMAMPTLMVPTGSVVGGRFTNRPGAIVDVNAEQAQGPYYLLRPPMPPDYSETMKWAVRYLHDISGVSAVDLGRTEESRVRSGIAIRQLKEQNEQRLAGIGQSTTRAIYGLGVLLLELLQERAVDDRLVAMVGEDNRSEILAFNRYSLRPKGYGEPGARTVLVGVGNYASIPDTPAEFLGSIDGLLEMGVLDPVADRELILKGAGLGSTQSFWDRDRIDENAELEVIDGWRRGQGAPPPRETDDHAVRLRVLSRWAKSDEYLAVVQRYPALAREIGERVQIRKQGVYDQLVEQQYLQRHADVRMWMKYRAAALEAGMDAALVAAVYPAPLSLMGGGQSGGGSEPGRDQNDGSNTSRGGPAGEGAGGGRTGATARRPGSSRESARGGRSPG